MNLNNYVKDATRTESRIEKVTVPDIETFVAALNIFIQSGQILDSFKKNVFYNKPVDWEKVELQLQLIESDSAIGFADRPTDISIDPRIFHALIGAATEATELMEALKLGMDGGDVDYVNVMEEFGDINWYEAIGCDATGVSFEDILTTNIEKLRKRFPEKFKSEEAINRNTDEERHTLETGFKPQKPVDKDG